MYLTEREQQIVTLLRADPMLGSEAIAQRLGTTRAAVNVHLSNLGKKRVVLGRGYILNEQPSVVVVGGANVDVKARSAARISTSTSNPGTGSMSPGGVGRNIAENLARLGTRTYLVTAVGRDVAGEELLAQAATAGVRLEYVHRTHLPTGTYVAVLDCDGEIVAAVSDMSAMEQLGPAQVNPARDLIASADLLVVDGNLPARTLAHTLDIAHAHAVRTVLDPVSIAKAGALAPHIAVERPLFAVTLSREELTTLTGLAARTERQVCKAASALHERGVEHVWVRLGRQGSLLSTASDGYSLIPALPADVVDVTGAGAAMLAAFCHAVLEGSDPVDAARYGHAAAVLTMGTDRTVREDLTPRMIENVLAGGGEE